MWSCGVGGGSLVVISQRYSARISILLKAFRASGTVELFARAKISLGAVFGMT